jgi:hypothetical protein
MKRTSTLIAIAAAVMTVTSSVAIAADPKQADFDTCNQMAQSKASASASPQTQPSASAPAQPSAGTPQAAPSPQPADVAKVEVQADQLRGIADAYKSDPAYQRAYAECMKGRGF